MKSFPSVFAAFLENRGTRTNCGTLLKLLLVLVSLVALYSVIFHVLMEREGRDYSGITGIYWTLTVMTTLGFGDITFASDAGKIFSLIVLVSGVMFLLVILPFTFIEFFYAPWMRAQAASRTPRLLPEATRRHVILTAYDPIAMALVPMLEKYGHRYVLLCSQAAEALELYEQGLKAVVGDSDDPETYERMRLRRAAMLVATGSDVVNTNIVFTARELNETVPIIASASSDAARDVLELAGATLVLRLEQMMGQALVRRIAGKDAAAHIIGRANNLIIAEANTAGTELEGLTLAKSGIRPRTGLSVIGLWNRGRLIDASPDTVIQPHTVLVLAGTEDQIERYNRTFRREEETRSQVLIVGGGKVGRIASGMLREQGFKPVLIEKNPARVAEHPEAIIGDATHMDVLKSANAREAAAILITPHDDDVNIALTIFFRRLRPNVQIICRCTLERNTGTLHRAGANLVLSSASMGANTIFNLLRKSDHLLLAEGVCLFPSPVPEAMKGRRLADSAVRKETGCTVISVETGGEQIVNPDPDLILPENARLLLIGTLEAEERFLKKFKPNLAPRASRGKRRKKTARQQP